MLPSSLTKRISENMVAAFLRLQQPDGSFQDPITRTRDPRPNAEIARGLLGFDLIPTAKRTYDWLLKKQNSNGSFGEITETEVIEENTLSTAVIARSLLDGYDSTKEQAYLKSAKKALNYVQSQEFGGGYIKSDNNYAVLLNVTATVAAIMRRMYELTNNSDWLLSVDRALIHVARHQLKDGAYPYATFQRAFPYEEHLNVRDLYYHSLTFFYLLLADPQNAHRRASFSNMRALHWLTRETRTITHWSNSKVIFAIGSIGFYAYSAYVFSHFKKDQLMNSCLQHLLKLQKKDGLFNRYEQPHLKDAVRGYVNELIEFEPICPTRYSSATRLMRLRRRIAHDLKNRRNDKTSLFYAAQVFNALSEMIVKQ
mgnify:CR=1 FL=1